MAERLHAILSGAASPHREVHHVTRRAVIHPNRSFERSLAFSASISRSRAGACVCSDASSRWAAADTSATARSNASALACDGLLKPDSFLTNCSAEASISSSVAGGSKLIGVLMLRHIFPSPLARLMLVLLASPRSRTIQRARGLHRVSFWHRMTLRSTPFGRFRKASEYAMSHVTY